MNLKRTLSNLVVFSILAVLAVFEFAARFTIDLALEPGSGSSANYGVSSPGDLTLAPSSADIVAPSKQN